MREELEHIRSFLHEHPGLGSVEAREEGKELHLEDSQGSHFVRLMPTGRQNIWRMELFRNAEEWEITQFTGTLEECLWHLHENPHYLFWER